MTVVNPPITGDPQTDSWNLQVTQMINQGLAPGLGGAVGGVAGSTTGGCLLYTSPSPRDS